MTKKFIKIYCLFMVIVLVLSLIPASIYGLFQFEDDTVMNIIGIIIINITIIFFALPMLLETFIIALKDYMNNIKEEK